MRSSFQDCYIEFVDDLRYVYDDDIERRPKEEDVITFLSRCTELERRHHTKKLSEKYCLYLSHWSIDVGYLGPGSENQNRVIADLSSVVNPFQCYLLSLSQDCSVLKNFKMRIKLIDQESC